MASSSIVILAASIRSTSGAINRPEAPVCFVIASGLAVIPDGYLACLPKLALFVRSSKKIGPIVRFNTIEGIWALGRKRSPRASRISRRHVTVPRVWSLATIVASTLIIEMPGWPLSSSPPPPRRSPRRSGSGQGSGGRGRVYRPRRASNNAATCRRLARCLRVPAHSLMRLGYLRALPATDRFHDPSGQGNHDDPGQHDAGGQQPGQQRTFSEQHDAHQRGNHD